MPTRPGEDSADWRAASQLLQSGEYEQVADLLAASGHADEQATNPLLAATVDAAYQLCLACVQCQADVEWHRHAGEEALQREQQLRQHVQSMLEHISGQEVAQLAQTGLRLAPRPEILSEPAQYPSLWRQVYNLFQRVKKLFVPEYEISMPPVAKAETAPTTPFFEAPPLAPDTALADNIDEETAASALTPDSAVSGNIAEEIVGSASALDPAVSDSVDEETVTPHALVPRTIEPITPVPSQTPLPGQDYTLVIYGLGPFRVYQHDRLIEEWNGLRGQAVLKYLIVHRGTPVAKDVLMDIFWPDTDPEAARRNLHQAIYSLRQTLRRRDPNMQHIQFENNQYLLNPALSVWVDFEEFQTHVQAGRRLEAAGQLTAAMVDYRTAEALYQGDFLAEDVYDDWPRSQRERLRTIYLDIADRLSEYYRQQGEYSAAIALCQKILTLDNCVEEAHRRLMRCYLAQGQRHLAIRQYHTCVQALADELDVPPDEETKALYASITASS